MVSKLISAAALALAYIATAKPLLQARNVELVEPSCNTFTPFQPIGCYAEASSGRALPWLYDSGLIVDNMTVEICQGACKGNGYQYAGLEYYGQCFCGASINTAQADGSNCNYPCRGNANETCGGNSFLSVYQDTTFPSAPAPAQLLSEFEYVGCYAENEPYRALTFQQTQLDETQMTVETCLTTCGTLGYSFGGVEFGQECWCGTALAPSAAQQAESVCSTSCTGNANETCGGSQLINVYYNPFLVSNSPCSGYPAPPSPVISTTTTTTTTTTTMPTTTTTMTTTTPTTTTTAPATTTTTTSMAATTTTPSTTSTRCSTTSTTTATTTSTTTTAAPTTTKCSTTLSSISTAKTTTSSTCISSGVSYTAYNNPFTQTLPWYPKFQASYFNSGSNPSVGTKFTGTSLSTAFTCLNPLSPTSLYNLNNIFFSQLAVKYHSYISVPTTGTYYITYQRCIGVCYCWLGSKATNQWSENNYDIRTYFGDFSQPQVPVTLTAGQLYPITMLFGNGVFSAGMQLSIKPAGGWYSDISPYLRQPTCGNDNWS